MFGSFSCLIIILAPQSLEGPTEKASYLQERAREQPQGPQEFPPPPTKSPSTTTSSPPLASSFSLSPFSTPSQFFFVQTVANPPQNQFQFTQIVKFVKSSGIPIVRSSLVEVPAPTDNNIGLGGGDRCAGSGGSEPARPVGSPTVETITGEPLQRERLSPGKIVGHHVVHHVSHHVHLHVGHYVHLTIMGVPLQRERLSPGKSHIRRSTIDR